MLDRMKDRTRTGLMVAVACGALLARWPGTVAAEPLFASPPHFLPGPEGARIVFFLNEALTGAFVAQDGADHVEVIVPHSRVDASIAGQDLGGEASGGRHAGVARLVLGGRARGNTSIRIETTSPVGGVEAHPVDDPPRLVIELRAGRGRPTPTAPRAREVASPALARAPQEPAPPVPSPTPAGRRVAGGPAAPTARAMPAAAPAADAAAPQAARSRPAAMPCRWIRARGVPFCAPDPQAPAYAAETEFAAMARALARPGAMAPELPRGLAGPALLYLAADRELVMRAPELRLLPAVEAYRDALRQAGGFADAARARMNIALAFYAMGFEAELRSAAAMCAGDPGAPLILALQGDLATERRALERAREHYRQAAGAGGIGPCLAARGRATLALETDRDPAQEIALVGELCPAEILADPETELVRARARAWGGDAAGARRVLETLRGALPRNRQGRIVAALAAAAEAAGDLGAARRAYEELAAGGHGAVAAGRAGARLALLDGLAGDTAAGLRRLERLAPGEPGEAASVRRTLIAHAATRALEQGDPAAAVALVHEQGIDPALLGVEERALLARAYREVGLLDEAARLVTRAPTAAGERASDALWAEQGAILLARGDAVAALAVAGDWLRLGGEAQPAALALRARALAALGDGEGARAAVAQASGSADAAAVRALRLDVGEALAVHEPAVALALLREGLASPGPELPAAAAARAWRRLALAAEAAGERSAALEAYGTLQARYPAEPATADAAYHAARLADGARAGGSGAGRYDLAARSGDPLARRVATAARDYEQVLAPLANVPREARTAP